MRAYTARGMNNLHRGNRGLYLFFIILLEQNSLEVTNGDSQPVPAQDPYPLTSG